MIVQAEVWSYYRWRGGAPAPRFHTSLDQKRFLLHARKEKTELSPRQNGREVQVGLVTQLVVELNLLETGRNTLSHSLIRVRGRTHAEDYSKHETPLWGNLERPSFPRTCKLTVWGEFTMFLQGDFTPLPQYERRGKLLTRGWRGLINIIPKGIYVN